MKPKNIVGVLLLVAFGFLVMRSFGQNVGGYMNFAEAEAAQSHAHVIGNWLRDRPLGYDPEANVFSFWMEDGAGNVRQVHYNRPKPANFEEAVEVVLEGRMEGEVFQASNILVKCPSKYNEGREFGDPSQHPESVPMAPASTPPASTPAAY